MNYSEIARKSGYSISAISRIMRGQRNPSLDALRRISKVMRISPATLMKRLHLA